MIVHILKDGPYQDFHSDPPYRAIQRQAGDTVDYPEWYATGLIRSGLAEAVDMPSAIVEPPTPEPAPEFKASEYKSKRRTR